ncbi:endonuclease-8 [Chitinophaga skermanii]|uniref:Endonuclease-8 n=1 Tax=Chitinophaga skermanii TaxID=331697 RepID=A0A327QF02_9BACT|nr:endonuclease [Chitinophaga skermanii]RAJ02354.1 endonuclease-8 [Chitinophaga skermanii]
MPEGPSIIILQEKVRAFRGKTVLAASGGAAIPMKQLKGQKITGFKTWGKVFLVCFKSCTIRIHFLLFGSYRINEHTATKPKLHLGFKVGELNFYACKVDVLKEDINDLFDFTADVLHDSFNVKAALEKVQAKPNAIIGDVLLDQHIFSGVGNIIRNEVLFLSKVHPQSVIAAIPTRKLQEIIRKSVSFSEDFLKWKRKDELKKHLKIYKKETCGNKPVHKQTLGKTGRTAYYCEDVQVLYKEKHGKK